jgi:hypothetical protein
MTAAANAGTVKPFLAAVVPPPTFAIRRSLRCRFAGQPLCWPRRSDVDFIAAR